ncbi:MAG TPA: alpha/beta fold hydrolase [Candidatus Saccharimonadales bacterium]|jgi:predicted alpha/beta-hydrolase family hydrolase|nr:alpha/beta fold hydrolase [Candidatus Saccharimonadales bacterium]
MPQDLSYKYYRKLNATTVYLVLHGGGPEGIETPFISNIINALSSTGNSVLGFNFPYCERGEENSSGPDLTEETEALEKVIEFLRGEGYEKIIIVAKSFGGIVSSYWLEQHTNEDVDLVVLGYVIGSIKTGVLQGRLRLVIQGENDRFGNAEAVKNEITKYDNIDADVVEVPKADHSYRNEKKEPIYQSDAIAVMLDKIAQL